MNRPIIRSETEYVIKTFPTSKVQDEMASQVNSTKHKIELIPILLKLFQKVEEGTLPKTFCEATITLIRKPDKNTPKKKITSQYIWWI